MGVISHIQVITLMLICLPLTSMADWIVMEYEDQASDYQTKLAYTANDDNYTLEIYKDPNNSIRTRFTLPEMLVKFEEKTCPTFQIDRGIPRNRSINDAPCISQSTWVEFVFGYASRNSVSSSALLGMMNGNNIIFRFKLENGDYRETQFSLLGSKRALTEAIGLNVAVISSQ